MGRWMISMAEMICMAVPRYFPEIAQASTDSLDGAAQLRDGSMTI